MGTVPLSNTITSRLDGKYIKLNIVMLQEWMNFSCDMKIIDQQEHNVIELIFFKRAKL